jgi:protoporphyrin/coproporphyrin ferrochelatase
MKRAGRRGGRGVLLVSHGTVADLDDLGAFVTNVRRGQPPSDELVAELRRRYEAIGSSPLNRINGALAAKLEAYLGLPVAWANRLWTPYVRDVLAALSTREARDGRRITKVALVPLAQHSAQVYADDARQAASGTGIDLACAANWGRSPALCDAFAARIVRALDAVAGKAERARTTVVMTAHSLPRAVVARGDPYADEVQWAAKDIARRVRAQVGDPLRCAVAFQSQGLGARGPDGKPIEWLGPDVRTVLDEARALGGRRVVFAPVGFLADHVEILYDLDIEARAMAEDRGLEYARAVSLNTDDDFVEVLAEVAAPLLDARDDA